MISLAAGDDRTLFFDFLPVSALTVRGFTAKFQLYTVPGQVYYNMTRKLVLRGADGMVFVADSQWDRLRENVESFRNLEENLREYNTSLDEMPYVIQYNKRDLEQHRAARLHGVPPQPAGPAGPVLRGRGRQRRRGVRHPQHRLPHGPGGRVRSRKGGTP